jgi:ABC-type antimicrobial peptide transport system permease subunit
VIGGISHGFFATQSEMLMCIGSIIFTFVGMYITFFILAIITTLSERKHIHTNKRWRLVTNVFTFPIFMMSYLPMNVVALFKKVEWVPTKHDIAVNFDDVVKTS